MRVRCGIVVLVLFSFSFGRISAQQRVSGQIIIQLQKNSSVEELLKSIPSSPHQIQRLSISWNIWLLEFQPGDEEKMLNIILKNPSVRLAQYNHYITKRSLTPNDPQFTEQWNLENTGQLGGTPEADISATKAWELATTGKTATGDTIVIAVVDEGFDLIHEDLRYWKNIHDIRNNGIDDDLNGYIDDHDGWDAGTHSAAIPVDFHGTHVAGIAAAIGNNGKGISGVAWNAQLLPVSVANYVESEVVEAYSYIFEMRRRYNNTAGAEGAFIVATNSSFGIDFGTPEEYPLWSAMYDSMGSVGILSAASTINLTTDVDIAGDIPSTCPSNHLIIVTNTTRYDTKSASAGFGLMSVDLGAPGTSIRSTTPSNGYVNSSGTSMASPHVAGAVAMMFSLACEDFMLAYHANPDSMALIVKNYILRGTDILPDLDGLTVSGGRLNLYSSMNMLYNDHCVTCMQVEDSVITIKCNGDSDGEIAVVPSQGVAPYIYEWSNGDSVGTLSGLNRGKYSVKISDANGCVKYRYFEITQPPALVVNLISDSAVNGANGSAAAFVSGGTEPYTYQWDDSLNSTDAILNDLSPGVYSVTVTDSNGCKTFKSIAVGGIVGIELTDAEKFQVTVHPNPVQLHAWIETSLADVVFISLFDISGKLLSESILSEQRALLDFSKFPQGTYIIKATTVRYSAIKKVIRL